jgi:hypothetical protein
VVGVGSAAYEAIGAAAAGIRFGVGTYVTYLALTGSGASRSQASPEGLARAIEARL